MAKNINLIIKKAFFDQIMSGEKTKEYREIRPKNASKYCVQDGEGILEVIQYETVTLFVGYQANRASAVVEVIENTIDLLTDDNGEYIPYEVDGKEYIQAEAIFHLGKILSKTNC